jgi:hypothetical protein
MEGGEWSVVLLRVDMFKERKQAPPTYPEDIFQLRDLSDVILFHKCA